MLIGLGQCGPVKQRAEKLCQRQHRQSADDAGIHGISQAADQRFQPMASIDFILALRPVQYRYRDGRRTHHGLLAQDVATALAGRNFAGHVLAEPSDPDSAQGLRYDAFIAPLIAAVQELTRRVEQLEARHASQR